MEKKIRSVFVLLTIMVMFFYKTSANHLDQKVIEFRSEVWENKLEKIGLNDSSNNFTELINFNIVFTKKRLSLIVPFENYQKSAINSINIADTDHISTISLPEITTENSIAESYTESSSATSVYSVETYTKSASEISEDLAETYAESETEIPENSTETYTEPTIGTSAISTTVDHDISTIDPDDLYLLAQIATCESGDVYIEDLLVCIVVLNRLESESPDFKDVNTIKEVLYQYNGTPMQQYGTETIRKIENGIEPYPNAIKAAQKALEMHANDEVYYYIDSGGELYPTDQLYWQTLTVPTFNAKVLFKSEHHYYSTY